MVVLIPALALWAMGCASATDLTRLQDEVRRLQTELDEMRKREAEAQVRLQEQRDKAVAGAASDVTPSPGEPAAATRSAPLEKPPAGSSPHQMYNAAFTKYNLGQHPEAVQLFRAFLATFPKHDLADNAQYWIGECHFARREYEQAAGEFQRVVENFPGGNKVPDAFVKKGLALLALNRREEAVESLRTVLEAFPKSDAAAYARQRLSEIQKADRPASRR
jgi:tol-pal system protein YbgF